MTMQAMHHRTSSTFTYKNNSWYN